MLAPLMASQLSLGGLAALLAIPLLLACSGAVRGVILEQNVRKAELSEKRKLEAEQYCEIWSSDLLRCRQTAELAGYPNAVLTSELREFDFGRTEGMLWDELSPEDQKDILNWSASFVRALRHSANFKLES